MALFSDMENKETSEEILESVEGNSENEASDDLATFREYQENVQQKVNDAKEISPEEIDANRRRLMSTVTGNSFLAETYEKKYSSMKQFEYIPRYKALLDKIKVATTLAEFEQLKEESENLKNEMYDNFNLAKRGALAEQQSAETASIVSINRRQLKLAVEKDLYKAEQLEKKYEYIKQLGYAQKFKAFDERLTNASKIEEIDSLKIEIRDLREAMEKDEQKAPTEEKRMERHQDMENVYNKILEEDLALACDILGYRAESKSAMTFKAKAEDAYKKMAFAEGTYLDALCNERDEYLKSAINRAFFLKCLNIDVKLHKLTADEKKEKYNAYLADEFDYEDSFKDKVRKKLSSKYQAKGQQVPIYLLSGNEFEEAFLNTYSVSNRIKRLKER